VSRIGVGIIGTGGIARAHVRGYASLADRCRIVAVADIDRDRAEQAAKEAGEDVAAFDDFQHLLEREDVQLVSICTPPFVHAQIAIAALRAGKHVLVEKPMAASLAECDAMIEAAEESGKKLAVVFQNRWRQDWRMLKAVVDSGALGRMLLGKVDLLWYRGHKYYDVWWRGTWERECGGVTINHAVHNIDGFLWLMGEPESVYAEMDALDRAIEVEDFSTAIVRFKSGAVGQILSTVLAQQNTDRVEVSGTRAGAGLPWSVSAVQQRDDGFPMDNPEVKAEVEAIAARVPALEHKGHAAQIEDLLDAIEEDRKPLVDGVEGRRAVELITGIYMSATLGARVGFPLDKASPFYTTDGLRSAVKRHGKGE